MTCSFTRLSETVARLQTDDIGPYKLHGVDPATPILGALNAIDALAGRDLRREIAPMRPSEGVGRMVWRPLAGGFLMASSTATAMQRKAVG